MSRAMSRIVRPMKVTAIGSSNTAVEVMVISCRDVAGSPDTTGAAWWSRSAGRTVSRRPRRRRDCRPAEAGVRRWGRGAGVVGTRRASRRARCPRTTRRRSRLIATRPSAAPSRALPAHPRGPATAWKIRTAGSCRVPPVSVCGIGRPGLRGRGWLGRAVRVGRWLGAGRRGRVGDSRRFATHVCRVLVVSEQAGQPARPIYPFVEAAHLRAGSQERPAGGALGQRSDIHASGQELPTAHGLEPAVPGFHAGHLCRIGHCMFDAVSLRGHPAERDIARTQGRSPPSRLKPAPAPASCPCESR